MKPLAIILREYSRFGGNLARIIYENPSHVFCENPLGILREFNLGFSKNFYIMFSVISKEKKFSFDVKLKFGFLSWWISNKSSQAQFIYSLFFFKKSLLIFPRTEGNPFTLYTQKSNFCHIVLLCFLEHFIWWGFMVIWVKIYKFATLNLYLRFIHSRARFLV